MLTLLVVCQSTSGFEVQYNDGLDDNDGLDVLTRSVSDVLATFLHVLVTSVCVSVLLLLKFNT